LVSSSIIDDDSTEAVIQRMIEDKRSFIREGPEGIQISSVTKRHFQLQIETLQNAPRDASKLEQIIKTKERQNEKARHIYDIQRLVTEIDRICKEIPQANLTGMVKHKLIKTVLWHVHTYFDVIFYNSAVA
jgi:hypothetical protein